MPVIRSVAEISVTLDIRGSLGKGIVRAIYVFPEISGKIPDYLAVRELELTFVITSGFHGTEFGSIDRKRLSGIGGKSGMSSGGICSSTIKVGCCSSTGTGRDTAIDSAISHGTAGPIVAICFYISRNRHPFVVGNEVVAGTHVFAGSDGICLVNIGNRVFAGEGDGGVIRVIVYRVPVCSTISSIFGRSGSAIRTIRITVRHLVLRHAEAGLVEFGIAGNGDESGRTGGGRG